MTDLTASEFAVVVRQIGLDPADHEMDELRAAYLRLQELFVKVETVPPAHDNESLSIFDPAKRL